MVCQWSSPPSVTLNIESISANFKDDIGHTYKLANKLLPKKTDKLLRCSEISCECL